MLREGWTLPAVRLKNTTHQTDKSNGARPKQQRSIMSHINKHVLQPLGGAPGRHSSSSSTLPPSTASIHPPAWLAVPLKLSEAKVSI
ncbi:hypothetical protein ABVT39_018121 [Epinephelus coioides]